MNKLIKLRLYYSEDVLTLVEFEHDGQRHATCDVRGIGYKYYVGEIHFVSHTKATYNKLFSPENLQECLDYHIYTLIETEVPVDIYSDPILTYYSISSWYDSLTKTKAVLAFKNIKYTQS